MNPFAAPYLYGLDAPPPREAVEAYVTALVVIARAVFSRGGGTSTLEHAGDQGSGRDLLDRHSTNERIDTYGPSA